MDNASYTPTEDNTVVLGVRRNSQDYQTPNIGSDDADSLYYTTLNVGSDDDTSINEKSEDKFGDLPYVEAKVNKDDEEKQLPKIREIPTKPYAGMNKEDLLRFSNTPFWNRIRTAILVIFWLCWIGLLAAVIALAIVLPRCKAPPSINKWQTSVYYQIYVRSFFDSNGDGIGDINGLTSKLDYLKENNVDAIVLSSIYKSHESGPRDFGYDVTNHTEVSPDYGTIEDFKNLLQEAHDRDISVVMDLVAGQTGQEHPWFASSSQSGDINTPMWNYYIWTDCTPNTKPNNWLSLFNDSAWYHRPTRNQCYLSQFLRNQPQLNLRSGAVRQEIENILRFWLDLGVDGFKVVNPSYLFVDQDLRNESQIPGCSDLNSYSCLNHTYTRNQNEAYDVIEQWRSILDQYSTATDRYSNQDMNRITGLFQPQYNDVVHILAVTLPGVAIMYYGDELGLVNGPQPAAPVDPVGAINLAWSRDPYRNPMPWNNDSTGGFVNESAGASQSPWLPVYTNLTYISVEVQNRTEGSSLNKFRSLTSLKNQQGSLQFGSFRFAVVNENIISYIREFNGHDYILVVANIGQSSSTVDITTTTGVPGSGSVIFTSSGRKEENVSLKSLRLAPAEGIIVSWPYKR